MVKTIQMKLDVNKTTANNEIIRIRQGDKNSTKLEVEVLYDGQPYSLTGLSATFNATKPDGKVVVENATTSENKIIYVLNSQVGAISGTISKAYFSIKNTSGVEIDSTSNFRIDVLAGTDASAGSSDYLDSLESTRLKAQKLLTQIDDSIAVVDGVVAQINTLGQQASDTLKEKLEGLSTKATTGVNEIKAQLQELISSEIAKIETEKTAALDKVSSDATAKIANIQSQADAKLASIQKDWNTLKPQLQAEINALSTKVSGIDDKSNTIKTRLDALVVQLDSIDIVSVKNTADKATADIATLTKSIDQKIDDIQVGGRNLLLDSKTQTKDGSWRTKNNGWTPEVGTYLGSNIFRTNLPWSNAKYSYKDLLDRDVINTTDDFTYSAYFRVVGEDPAGMSYADIRFYSTATTKNGYIPLQLTSLKEGQWARVVVPFKFMDIEYDEANAGNYSIRVEMKVVPKVAGAYYEFVAPKLEKGNKATDLSPAPEDISAEIDTKISKLTKSVNGIKPDASGNISLPQPDLTPYVTNSALTLKLASYYDKTTADGRYLPKTTSFATPAQVTTAETNAKSYADTKKSEAQSYTDSKLSGVLKSWTGTQAQYDAIATKDPNTLYIIVDGVV